MRRFLIVSVALLALAYAIGIPLFLGGDDDSLPKGADAVVALAGSDRTLPAAQTLVGGGIAPLLVVSAERNAGDARTRLCRAKPSDVICIYAGPYSSVGEAQAVSELAKRRDWDTVVLVTSDYETFRAERAFRRCGNFRVATSGVDEPWWRTAIGIPLEWVKLAVTETVRRGC
ncbi:MAG: YdcF family protein [Gaiella sp.]|nr:YdcF family protein [Gaiella sp.]